ncbi:hypothetical protein MKY96_33150 [Paenibacillus sp. FSL R7-0302]|uniref:hypothetical protein n=1 Tax=Paenibacillus sp. FSL R7-0302 TaxID=2921681 RepID=UPI0030F6E684
MVSFELMSDNLVILLGEIIKNQNIVKYVSNNVKNPLSQPDILLPAKNLIGSKLHPYPFDPVTTPEDSVEIRVYYPEGAIDDSRAVLQTTIYVDIVCAKSLWLINDGKSGVRPYMIVHELFRQFNKKSVSTIGRLDITGFDHLHVNDKFDAIRLHTQMVTFGG